MWGESGRPGAPRPECWQPAFKLLLPPIHVYYRHPAQLQAPRGLLQHGAGWCVARNSLCAARRRRLSLNQQYLAASPHFAICLSARTVHRLSPQCARRWAVVWVMRGFCHVRLYDQVTKEINRKPMSSIFHETVCGVSEVVVSSVWRFVLLSVSLFLSDMIFFSSFPPSLSWFSSFSLFLFFSLVFLRQGSQLLAFTSGPSAPQPSSHSSLLPSAPVCQEQMLDQGIFRSSVAKKEKGQGHWQPRERERGTLSLDSGTVYTAGLHWNHTWPSKTT